MACAGEGAYPEGHERCTGESPHLYDTNWAFGEVASTWTRSLNKMKRIKYKKTTIMI